MIASEGWTARPERDLAVAYIFWTARARKALDARKYPQDEQLANQSLRLRSDQPKAFQVLVLARLSQSNFSGAAEAYRKILEIDKTSHPEIIAAYAQALAAADRVSALAEFQRWAEGVKGERLREADVQAAGLALLAGNSESERKLEAELKENGAVQAPSWIGELGWWTYLDGDYQKAVDMLSESTQQPPGDTNHGLQLAWAMIEVRRYGVALQTLEIAVYQQQAEPERAMARAVARWKAQELDQALLDFNVALAEQPEWGNSSWVKALYSPLVAQSIQEMQAERERRKQKVRAAASR